VRALARSERAAARVRELGAEPVSGDLGDPYVLAAGAEGCEVAFHCAAKVEDWGEPEEFERLNVQGTRNVVDACRRAGVHRLVHVGTEAALTTGQPLLNVDESAALRPDSPFLYSATKARAEQVVRDAGRDGLETVVIRPRFVWGRGDTTLLPAITELVQRGRFRWVGGGRHLTDTTHVDNTVEGLWLGATKAPAGGVYFVTDGGPVVFREFVTRMLATRGVTPPDKSLPAGAARAAAIAAERAWRTLRLPGSPPVTRFAIWASSEECTIDISRAERELSYRPIVTREEGLAAMQS
jgi:nucleoside-diphosphate-sugar epimerase